MSAVVNSDRIPNNVDLASDKKLQRALEAWQPRFIEWWKEMGPEGFQEDQVYLRTAVSVDHDRLNHPGADPRRARLCHGDARLRLQHTAAL